MWFELHPHDDEAHRRARIERLENYHRRHDGFLFGLIVVGFVAFVVWASIFRVDEVAAARGDVIASSRVQVIQSVDGGVLTHLYVKEGDRVKRGQLLATLDQTRIGAMVGETSARLFALRAKAARLRAEVTGADTPKFPKPDNPSERSQVEVERALFEQRRHGLKESLHTLRVALDLAEKKLSLVEELLKSGDVSGSELLAAKSGVNEAEARLINQRNKFFEDARTDLSRAEDEIAQNAHELTKRLEERKDTVFTSKVDGIVKSVKVTTVGGVLRPSEEIMEIVPVDDALIVEAKVRPADIAQVRPGLEANIRFDPFDYTIFGSVRGKVTYVSADTLKEQTPRGEEVYYRVHVVPDSHPVTTTIGRHLDILPGMTAQVDIRTGDRTVMDYLLKPLRKTFMDSFRER